MKWLENGELHVNDTTEPKVVFRQVGWLGQTGTFYGLNQDGRYIKLHEKGGFSPIYVQVLPE